MKKVSEVTLFGVDMSPFNQSQQAFLILTRYSIIKGESEAACIRASGLSPSTVKGWKRNNPQFKEALKRVRATAIQVDAEAAENPHILQARETAQDIIADVTPTAAQQLSELIQVPWPECTDRGKSTKLKGIEDALKITGVEGKGKNSSGKINLLQLIYEIGEKDAS